MRANKKLASLLLLVFFAIRTWGIFTDFSNSDAQRWHSRSEKFYQGLRLGNFKETYQRYHPGVTLMWISSGAQLALKTYTLVSGVEYKSIGNVEGYILHDGVSKILIVTSLLLLLYLQVRLITNIFGAKTGLVFLVLVSLEPYLVGIDRWYHLTSLEAYLSFTAFLFVWQWTKARKTFDLVVGGVLLGLAVLTRFSAGILLPILLIQIIATKPVSIKPYVSLLFPAVVTTFCLFPALWVAPYYVGQKLVSAGTEALAGDYQSIALAQTIPALYYGVVLLTKLSGLTVGLFVLALFKLIKTTKPFVKQLILYILVYLAVLTMADQKIERYIILVFLPLLLLISVYLSTLKPKLLFVLLGSTVVFNLFIYINYFPFPALYYSPVISGVKGAYQLGLLDTNGEYYAHAARYLNARGRSTTVYVPTNSQSFIPYFNGILKSSIAAMPQYLVISADTAQLPSGYEACLTPEKVFTVDGLAYLTIFKCF